MRFQKCPDSCGRGQSFKVMWQEMIRNVVLHGTIRNDDF